MKKSRYSEEQIIRALQEQESEQKTILVLCSKLGIAQLTFHNLPSHFLGSMQKLT
jgi:hypothetical protein